MMRTTIHTPCLLEANMGGGGGGGGVGLLMGICSISIFLSTREANDHKVENN